MSTEKMGYWPCRQIRLDCLSYVVILYFGSADLTLPEREIKNVSGHQLNPARQSSRIKIDDEINFEETNAQPMHPSRVLFFQVRTKPSFFPGPWH